MPQSRQSRRSTPPRAARGQTLVLWALALLLLTLMVLVTLGLGMRARERIELQIASDTAAYSNAVAAARTMNMVAVLTRAHLSHMVAMTAVESLISWSGQMKGSMAAIQAGLDGAAAGGGSCGAAVAAAQLALTGNTGAAFETQWDILDNDAGTQARALQGAGSTKVASLAIKNKLIDQLQDQMMTRLIAKAANPELEAKPSAGGRNIAAMSVLMPSNTYAHAVNAALGSRGDVFTRDRVAGFTLSPVVYGSVPGVTVVLTSGGGGAGFGPDAESAQGAGANSLRVWGEDHAGTVEVTVTGCPPFTAPIPDTHVMSDEEQWVTDSHVIGGGPVDVANPTSERHTMGACTVCDGMWPFFYDYDQTTVANGGTNLFGQPVITALVHRDFSARPKDPWNLRFNFRFSSGEDFDNGNPNGKMATNDALKYQVALSTAVVYYHRPQHFKEPPNMFNPFWRATLMSAQKKDPAGGMDGVVTAAGFGPHGQAMQQLINAGFKGVQ